MAPECVVALARALVANAVLLAALTALGHGAAPW
jgi:hypothetical protein